MSINELGAPTELIVTDNGHGIDPDKAWKLFLTEGDSWKKDKRFSDSLNRPLHGQMGRGRLITYSVAERVEWSSVSSTQGGPQRIVIRGTRKSPNGFDILDPEDVNESAGTTVNLTLRDVQKAAKIARASRSDGEEGHSTRRRPSVHVPKCPLPGSKLTFYTGIPLPL